MKTEATGGRSLSDERSLLNCSLPEIQRGLQEMDAFSGLLESRPMEVYLQNLAATVDRIGSDFPRRPVEYPWYATQWAGFLAGGRKDLDAATVRYLFWEPVVATDERFLGYVIASGRQLTRRPLAGLIRSFHRAWREGRTKDLLEPARTLVRSYDGPSPVILKWQSDLEYVLSDRGPEMLGQLLVAKNRSLGPFLDEWYLDSRSPFAGDLVEAAVEACGTRLGAPTRSLIELLFGELLPWPEWEPNRLRQQVARLILESSMTGQVREILQRFILVCDHLGDPRIKENHAKWVELPQKARDRVVVWLARNPFRLLEQVYQEGRGWVVRPWGEGVGTYPATDLAQA